MDTIVKIVIVGALFIPIVFKALKYNKWYLYILFGFYSILPDTFAIELSASLPLITGSRILVLIICCIWVYNLKFRKREGIPKEILVYVLVEVCISIINLRQGFGEVNNIFITVVQQFMLVMAVKATVEEEEEVYNCIDFLIYGSVALGIISILQTVLKFDVTTVLNITQERVVENITDRMNRVRAFGVTNAISNGCYCAFMCLITMFMYEHRRRFRYIIFLVVNAVALLCTMTRSALLAFGITVVVMALVRNRYFIRTYAKYIVLALVGIIGIFILKPSIFDSVIEVFKSILNVLGFDFELSDDFGLNADNASNSRLMQWSAIYYMAKEGLLLFGYGYNAFLRGRLYYYFIQFEAWVKAPAVDTGFVAIATQGGVISLFNNLLLWTGIVVSSIRNRDRRHKAFDIYKLTIYIAFMYIIINVASAFANTELIWLYLAIFFSYRKLKYEDKHRALCQERKDYICKMK